MNIRKTSILVGLLCVISAWEFGSAAYIHAKAGLAQHLVERAWKQSRQAVTSVDGSPRPSQKIRPWPWSDSWPVARLHFPGQGISQVVLAGATGSSLAFAPGWMQASARPGTAGRSVIAAHRDTHFSRLRDLRVGDEIRVETLEGDAVYRVSDRQVVDASGHRLILDTEASQLVLVTCYPFDAIRPGGSLRYLVIADRIPESRRP